MTVDSRQTMNIGDSDVIENCAPGDSISLNFNSCSVEITLARYYPSATGLRRLLQYLRYFRGNLNVVVSLKEPKSPALPKELQS